MSPNPRNVPHKCSICRIHSPVRSIRELSARLCALPIFLAFKLAREEMKGPLQHNASPAMIRVVWRTPYDCSSRIPANDAWSASATFSWMHMMYALKPSPLASFLSCMDQSHNFPPISIVNSSDSTHSPWLIFHSRLWDSTGTKPYTFYSVFYTIGTSSSFASNSDLIPSLPAFRVAKLLFSVFY